MKLQVSKTQTFTKSTQYQRHKSTHQRLMEQKKIGYQPPSLREIVKPKNGQTFKNASSLRTSKNPSLNHTGKSQHEQPDSGTLKTKPTPIITQKQKKSDFLQTSYNQKNSSNKKNSCKKSASKRELLSMSVLSDNRNTKQTLNHLISQGPLLHHEPHSALQKTERHKSAIGGTTHNSTRRQQDSTRFKNERSLIYRKVSQENLRCKKVAVNNYNQLLLKDNTDGTMSKNSNARENKVEPQQQDLQNNNAYRDASHGMKSATRSKNGFSQARQERNKSTVQAFNQIMRESRETQKQHYSNLYSKHAQSQHTSVRQKTAGKKEESNSGQSKRE